jgi:hypothetical protein
MPSYCPDLPKTFPNLALWEGDQERPLGSRYAFLLEI